MDALENLYGIALCVFAGGVALLLVAALFLKKEKRQALLRTLARMLTSW